MEDNLCWKTSYDGRRLMMKDDNEDDLKNKEDLHRWKAHGAGHIPLCGIFKKYRVFLRMETLASASALILKTWTCFLSNLVSQICSSPQASMVTRASSWSSSRSGPSSNRRAASGVRAGTNCCTWPRSARPHIIPFLHSKYTWSGVSNSPHGPHRPSPPPILATLSLVGRRQWSSLNKKAVKSLGRPGILASLQVWLQSVQGERLSTLTGVRIGGES